MIGRIALFLLCVILFVWAPASFAAELGTTLPSLWMRGTLGIFELSAHGVVTALSVAAGWALWQRRPHGPPLARAALIGQAIVGVQSLYWSVLPTQTPPGSELPLAALSVGHAVLWLVYLQRSPVVRSIS